MAVSRRRGESGLSNPWPGYVDALSTLLMVTIFVLLIFVLAQAFLAATLSSRNKTLETLNREITQLTSILSLEKGKVATLEQTVASLSQQVSQANAARATLAGELSGAEKTAAASVGQIAALKNKETSLSTRLADARLREQAANDQLTSLQQKLASALAQAGAATQKEVEAGSELTNQEQLTKSAQAQVALLNEQLAALRAQLAAISQALDIAQKNEKAKDIEIADLGRKLNVALAEKVQRLEKYRSDFFGDLRKVLADVPDIRIVGDRFVFETAVLFPLDSAKLTPMGTKEINKVAEVLKTIAPKIPKKLHWILHVDGYADSQRVTGGPYRNNWDLSAARALAVLHLLIADGIPPNRIAAAAFGDQHPINPAHTQEAYAENRRIEFRLTNY